MKGRALSERLQWKNKVRMSLVEPGEEEPGEEEQGKEES